MTTLTELFDSIADAIREKDGTTTEIAALDFPSRILAIQGGGSGEEEPSSGPVFALLYEDGFMSIQYGSVTYDADEHGEVARTYADWMPDAGQSVSKTHWPWYSISGTSQIAVVSVRHRIAFTNCTSMFEGCSALCLADMANADMSQCVSLSGMFTGLGRLGCVYGCDRWDTRAVSDVSNMFSGCENLVYVDTSAWNTASVTTLDKAFNGCSSLGALDVAGWDTSSVTTAEYCFYGCTSLSALDVSRWRPAALTTASYMFASCTKLSMLDLSGWEAASLTTCTSMFEDCWATSISIGTSFGGALTSVTSMFSGTKATSLDLRAMEVGSCTSLRGMFQSSSLVTLDLSSWYTSNVTDMSYLLGWSSALTTVYVGDGWTTSAVTKSNYVMYGCSKLVGGNGTKFSTNSITYARADLEGQAGYFTYKAKEVS